MYINIVFYVFDNFLSWLWVYSITVRKDIYRISSIKIKVARKTKTYERANSFDAQYKSFYRFSYNMFYYLGMVWGDGKIWWLNSIMSYERCPKASDWTLSNPPSPPSQKPVLLVVKYAGKSE